MMYKQIVRSPELIDTRDKGIVLRSNSNVNFKEYKLNNDIYAKSPHVRGCSLWKQLPATTQNANSLTEFNQLLTNDLIKSLKT